jgi:hypothetical protein
MIAGAIPAPSFLAASFAASAESCHGIVDLMHYLSESIDLPSSVETTHAVVSDLGLLLRLSSFWTLNKLTIAKNGRSEAVLDHYAGTVTTTCFFMVAVSSPQKLCYTVTNGPFQEMVFGIEVRENGVRLIVDLGLDGGDEATLRQSR